MRKAAYTLLLGIMLIAAMPGMASVKTDIEKAAAKHKHVFLIVTEPGAIGIEKVRGVVNQAHEAMPESVVVEMNRAASANSQLVKDYRLAGVKTPFVLVVASNGVPAGGMLGAQATSGALLQMIPSPRQADTIKAISEGKAVFLVASRDSMSVTSKVLEACKAACTQLKGKAVIVPIDMDDSKETGFLKKMQMSTDSTAPLTYVLNPQGKLIWKTIGVPPVNVLVRAAAKKGGGCCPGGSKKSCATK